MELNSTPDDTRLKSDYTLQPRRLKVRIPSATHGRHCQPLTVSPNGQSHAPQVTVFMTVFDRLEKAERNKNSAL